VTATVADSGLDASLIVALVLAYVALFVLILSGWVKILSKAGYSGWWVLIGFVPVVNFIMLLIFAFSDWPVLREVRRLRSGGYTGFSSGPTEGPLARRYAGPLTLPPHPKP
jgi:energy-coupling factor transporter transmembrane protein EcfT